MRPRHGPQPGRDRVKGIDTAPAPLDVEALRPADLHPPATGCDRPKAGSAGIDHSKQWSGCGAGLPGESLQTTCHGADPQPDKVRSAPIHLCNAPPRPGQAGRDATAPGTPPRRSRADAAFTATHRLPLVAESGPPAGPRSRPSRTDRTAAPQAGPPRRPKRSHQDQSPRRWLAKHLGTGYKPRRCGCSSMVEQQPSKLNTWVRFPSPAPFFPFRSPSRPAPGFFLAQISRGERLLRPTGRRRRGGQSPQPFRSRRMRPISCGQSARRGHLARPSRGRLARRAERKPMSRKAMQRLSFFLLMGLTLYASFVGAG